MLCILFWLLDCFQLDTSFSFQELCAQELLHQGNLARAPQMRSCGTKHFGKLQNERDFAFRILLSVIHNV